MPALRARCHPVVTPAWWAAWRGDPQADDGVRRLEGRAASTLEKHRSQIESFEALADELGYGPGDVALAWLLHQPAVTGSIIGPRTLEQLDAAIKAVGIEPEASVLQRLDEIFPGHRTAPEDYAW